MTPKWLKWYYFRYYLFLPFHKTLTATLLLMFSSHSSYIHVLLWFLFSSYPIHLSPSLKFFSKTLSQLPCLLIQAQGKIKLQNQYERDFECDEWWSCLCNRFWKQKGISRVTSTMYKKRNPTQPNVFRFHSSLRLRQRNTNYVVCEVSYG